MGHSGDSYYFATRHPWSCLVFLIPILLFYEGGVFFLGSGDDSLIRTGADTWLRWLLQNFGLPAMHWPPAIIGVILFTWSWLQRHTRPRDLGGIWVGMAVESVAFALLLWGLGRIHEPLLDRLGVRLAQGPVPSPRMAQTLSYLGAGIYEEMIFRLMLFPFLLWAIRASVVSKPLAVGAAMLLSALAFAAAHHVGPAGEPLESKVFVFRTLAGLYFVLLYQLRGFGVAVGAHAFYDVLVGVFLT